MEPLREVGVVFSVELRRFVRSAKGVALLVLFALGGGIAGTLFVAASSATVDFRVQIEDQLAGRELPAEIAHKAKVKVLAFFYDLDDSSADVLLDSPAVLLFLFWITKWFLPLLVLLMGFDQLSGELSLRSLRYVVVRARRGSVVVGKFLAQLAVLAALVLLLNAGLFAVAAIRTGDVPVAAGLGAVFRFWLVSVAFLAVYLGLTSLASAAFRSPWFSLLSGVGVLFVLWLTHVVSKISGATDSLRFVLPTRFASALIQPTLLGALPAVAAFLAAAGLLVAASWSLMRVRDL